MAGGYTRARHDLCGGPKHGMQAGEATGCRRRSGPSMLSGGGPTAQTATADGILLLTASASGNFADYADDNNADGYGAVSRAGSNFAPLPSRSPSSQRLGGPPHFGRRTFALISSISFTIFFSTFLRRVLISTVCWGKGRGKTRWGDVKVGGRQFKKG